MSEILSEVVETVTEEIRRVTGIKCDICGEIVPIYGKYFRVTTGHHEWGNDSVDSIKAKDICPGCIGKFVTEYLTDNCDTAYIDIETRHVYSTERRERR